MSGRRHIPRRDIDRNPPPRAHTHGLPWVSRAAWIAFAQLPSNELVRPSIVKLVLWDLVYVDGSRTTQHAIATRCNTSLRQVCSAVSLLEASGLIEYERHADGCTYTVHYEAVAALDRVRAPTTS